MPTTLPAMPKLEIKPYPDGYGGHAILVDGQDLGAHCVKAVLTLLPDGASLELTLLVPEVQTAQMKIDGVQVYRVCADCGARHAQESAEMLARYAAKPVD